MVGSIVELTNGIDSFIASLKNSLFRIVIFDGLIATWYIPCLIAVEIIFWIELKKSMLQTV